MNSNLDKVKLSLIKRKREEALFRFYGLVGIISAILFLIIILYSVISQGQKAFFTTFIKVDVYFDSEIIDPENKRNSEDIQFADFGTIISESLKRKFPHISDKSDVRELASFISTSEADNLAEFIVKNKNVFVIHGSKLPSYRGFAPIQQQILENKNIIPFSLVKLSVHEKVDAGEIVMRSKMILSGDELYDEIRLKQMPVYTLIDSDDVNETPIDISDPVTLEYTVPADTEYNFSNEILTGDPNEDLEGRKYKLEFEGFGNLYNIPGRVVDVCNDSVIGKYTDNWNNCYRYVHDFVIPNGTILKDTNGANYLKVKALRGDEYLKKIDFVFDTFTKTIGDVPGDNDLQNIFTIIGPAPDITHPAANSDKAAVVHGVTVHPATP